MLIKLPDPDNQQTIAMPLLALGFRPFFLLAGIFSAAFLLVWGVLYAKGGPQNIYGSINWHGHEMIFGFVSAVIAGFLLTAVKNWTGRQTVHGVPLLLLAMMWLLGRVTPFFNELPYWLVAFIDLSFLPLLVLSILPLLLTTKNYRNLVFVVILLMLTLANGAFHLAAAGLFAGGERHALYAGVYIILVLISIMGGRVIPFFIERGLDGQFQRKQSSFIETSSTLLLVVLGITHVAALNSALTAGIAMLAAALHLLRLSGWYDKGIWRVPLLWVLVLGYAWIVTGLFLLSLSLLGLIAISLALHALTIGGIGVLTMGMMVRVSMGHSGRKLLAPGLLPAAFAALNVAALVRVLLPLLLPTGVYSWLVSISALIWSAAFAVFIYQMWPVYFSARVDDRPS